MLLFYLRLDILRPELRERASHTTFVCNFNENHSESDPTRAIPAEGSSASVQIRTAPQRERSDAHNLRRGFVGDVHGAAARALRHARSPQRVRRPRRKFARRHSESAPTRTIPAEGSSASFDIRTAPQRERADTHDPRRGFIPPAPASARPRIRKKIEFTGCELRLGKLGCVSQAA